MPGHSPFDYDASNIAAVYDRAREHGPEVLDQWMSAVASAVRGRAPVRSVLDLGCGTGRFAFGLARRLDSHVIGLDPSSRMLARAREKPGDARVRFAAGRGEALPVRDDEVDVVFMSMVFHHFSSPTHVARECRRVMRSDGAVFLRTGTLDRVPSYPFVPFFPTSIPLLYATLPSCASVVATFEAAGFRTSEHGALEQQIAETHAQYASKLAAGADSVLARLDRRDFDAGLASIRAYAKEVDPRPVTEAIDYFVFHP